MERVSWSHDPGCLILCRPNPVDHRYHHATIRFEIPVNAPKTILNPKYKVDIKMFPVHWRKSKVYESDHVDTWQPFQIVRWVWSKLSWQEVSSFSKSVSCLTNQSKRVTLIYLWLSLPVKVSLFWKTSRIEKTLNSRTASLHCYWPQHRTGEQDPVSEGDGQELPQHLQVLRHLQGEQQCSFNHFHDSLSEQLTKSSQYLLVHF